MQPVGYMWRIIFVLSFVLLVAEQSAGAQPMATYEPDRDNTIYEENENSNGAGLTVTIGRTSGNMGTLSRRALLRFDIAPDLPKGATINSATLTMGVQRGNPAARDASLYLLTEDWGEGTGASMGGQGVPATAGDATWTCRFSDGAAGCVSGDEWSFAGGSFVGAPSATASVGEEGTTVSWSSAQMAADVQDWFDAPDSNHGWIVIGIEDVTSTSKQLHSREATEPLDRPELAIEYTCPDFDDDGHENVVCSGTDCDDEDDAINPDAAEVCDGIDNDCDPATDDQEACNMMGTGGAGGMGGAAGMAGAAGVGGAAGTGGTTDGSGGGCAIAHRSPVAMSWPFGLSLAVLLAACRRRRASP
ncbi:MAG: DNRLRE domain-containing protein [Polyangiales bacterium]